MFLDFRFKMYEAELWPRASRLIRFPSSRVKQRTFLQYFNLNQKQKTRTDEMRSLIGKFFRRLLDVAIDFLIKSSIHGLSHLAAPKRHFSERCVSFKFYDNLFNYLYIITSGHQITRI